MTKTITKKRKRSVCIVGPGRLGQALAIALHTSGYRLLAFVARHPRDARKAARRLPKSAGSVASLAWDQLSELPETDLILITTPDDFIAEASRRLATTGKPKQRHRTVLHTSGALASDVLGPLAELGFHTGSMHPLVSVSDPVAGAKALRGAFYCLEGDRSALRVARSVVADLDGKSFSIRPENKALYHAAAVTASPHLVALFDLAAEMLAACGLSKKYARQVLLPLLESTTRNLMDVDPEQALTGTFARGDVATVRRHLAVLSGAKLAEALEVYRSLGKHSLRLAQKNGLAPERVEQIIKLLSSADREQPDTSNTKSQILDVKTGN